MCYLTSRDWSSDVCSSDLMKEDINALKDWAKTRARSANTPEDIPEQRKIRRKE
jgi:hypothetical protein